MLTMLRWWYGQGWLWPLRTTREYLTAISKSFAIGVLLKTWFAPWKQIYSPAKLGNFLQSFIDNTISRLLGAVVRSGILICALVLASFTIIAGVLIFLLWPLIPLSFIILPLLAANG